MHSRCLTCGNTRVLTSGRWSSGDRSMIQPSSARSRRYRRIPARPGAAKRVERWVDAVVRIAALDPVAATLGVLVPGRVADADHNRIVALELVGLDHRLVELCVPTENPPLLL